MDGVAILAAVFDIIVTDAVGDFVVVVVVAIVNVDGIVGVWNFWTGGVFDSLRKVEGKTGKADINLKVYSEIEKMKAKDVTDIQRVQRGPTDTDTKSWNTKKKDRFS